MQSFKVTLFVHRLWNFILAAVSAIVIGSGIVIAAAALVEGKKYISLAITAGLFTILGAYGFFAAIKKANFMLLFEKYATVLSTDPTFSLLNISYTLSIPLSDVRRDITRMIKSRLLFDVCIDETTNCLVFLTPPKINIKSRRKTVSVQCEFCGAPNAVTEGLAAKCEYCGQSLSMKIKS